MPEESDEISVGSASEAELAMVHEAMAYVRLENELRAQSDRGAAIIAAALVDDSLKAFLMSRLLITEGKGADGRNRDTKCMFNPEGGVLGSFSAKIRMAYAMRLISDEMFTDLMDIKGIRNDFAHWPHDRRAATVRDALGFDTHTIRDRCRMLRFPDACPPETWIRIARGQTPGNFQRNVHELLAVVGQHDAPPTDARERYVFACQGLAELFDDGTRYGDLYLPASLVYQRANTLGNLRDAARELNAAKSRECP